MPGLRALILFSLSLGTAASARTGQDPELPKGPDPVLISIGKIDSRFTVPVSVGAAGPFDFVIDTGAERTVVSRELADQLRLVPAGEIGLTSMSERSMVDTVIVRGLAIKSIGQLHTIRAPALRARNLGASGLLGIDTLAGHKVSIDFEGNQMTVSPSVRRSAKTARDPDEIVISARSKFGQLIVTDAFYGKTPIRVVIDTGTEVSLGNSALRRRVARGRKSLNLVELTSVTGGKTQAEYAAIQGIKLGSMTFSDLTVAFADVAPFERFGLGKRPALLLGMDVLRTFRRVDIDFPNREIRFRMPNDPPDA